MKTDPIREAFEKITSSTNRARHYDDFTAGYLALLNELEFVSYPREGVETLYRLPEGVEKCS